MIGFANPSRAAWFPPSGVFLFHRCSMLRRIAGAPLLLLILGCGAPAAVSTTPVEGVVKIGNTPAGNLLIQFSPSSWPDGVPMLTASAVSDANGKFVLKCSNGEPGAALGKHKVVVIDNNLSDDDDAPKPGRKAIVSRVSPVYNSAATSSVEIEVSKDKAAYEILLVANPAARPNKQ